MQLKEGKKYDAGKARIDLVPPELITGVAHVLAFGAEKYEARNWELGMDWGRVYAAMFRHMLAWWEGEDSDPETGMSHLWHAAACITFLMAYEQRMVGTDTRPKGVPNNAKPGNDATNSVQSDDGVVREVRFRSVRGGGDGPNTGRCRETKDLFGERLG